MSSKKDCLNLSQQLLKKAEELNKIGSQIFLVGKGILNFTHNEKVQLEATIITLVGGVLLTASNILQFIQNYISENPIPKDLNYNKLLGSILGLVGAIILAKVIFKEYELKLPEEEIESTSIV